MALATGWAIDLGTTNIGIACCDEVAEQPILLHLPKICRRRDADDPLQAPRMVPSAVHMPESPRLP